MERVRHLGAYGICRDGGDVLLARLADGLPDGGRWALPGGGVEWGEHPDDAVRREVFEETGLTVEVGEVLGIYQRTYEPEGLRTHAVDHVGILYAVRAVGGGLRDEAVGSTDRCAWVPIAALVADDLAPLPAYALGLLPPAAGPAALRRAVPSDASAVADVWLRARHGAVPDIPPPAHPDGEVRAWVAEVVVPSRETWVAERDGVVVGVLVLDGDEVDQLYVDPDHQGRGVGSLLLARARFGADDGLELWTFAANAGARRFYERHGFEAVGGTDGDNEEGAPDVRYRWRRRG